jgi:hypothetical protein
LAFLEKLIQLRLDCGEALFEARDLRLLIRREERVLTKIVLERRGERAFSHPAYAAEGLLAWFERDAGDWLAQHAAPDKENSAEAAPRA